jgi:hypothetical protein
MRCPVHWSYDCRCGYARTLALSFAGVVIACVPASPAPAPCVGADVELLAHEASCLAQVKERCAGIPLDEPCPFEEDCKAFTRERCK